ARWSHQAQGVNRGYARDSERPLERVPYYQVVTSLTCRSVLLDRPIIHFSISRGRRVRWWVTSIKIYTSSRASCRVIIWASAACRCYPNLSPNVLAGLLDILHFAHVVCIRRVAEQAHSSGRPVAHRPLLGDQQPTLEQAGALRRALILLDLGQERHHQR